MKKNLFLIGSFILLLGSCTKNNTLQVKEPKEEKTIIKNDNLNLENITSYKNSLIRNLSLIDNALKEEASLKSLNENSNINKQTEDIYKKALEPLIQDSKDFLLNEGVSNEDLIEIFGEDEHLIVIGALVVFDKYNKSLYPQTRANVLDCLGRALIGEKLGNISSQIVFTSRTARKLALKLVKATVLKAGMGHIGVAITVAVFTHCMITE